MGADDRHVSDVDEMYRRLKTYSPKELDLMRDQVEEELEELQSELRDAQSEVKRSVREFLRAFANDARDSEVWEAARSMAEGGESELLDRTLERGAVEVASQRYIRGLSLDPETLKDVLPVENFEVVEDPKAVEEFEEKVSDVKRSMGDLNDLSGRALELERRQRVVNRLLSEWAQGKIDLGAEKVDEEGDSKIEALSDRLRQLSCVKPTVA